MQLKEGERDWQRWRQVKVSLDEAYKAEEDFLRRKSRINWFKEGDKNTKFFHATTSERRKKKDWNA